MAIGHRGWGGSVIESVLGFALGSADRSPPLNLAGDAAQAKRDQLVALGSGEKNAVPYQHGRRLPSRQLGLPKQVLVGPELGWQLPA